MLEVKQVSKWYENKRGVQHIDFSMQKGEIVGFLGPNGAGKTTTMRMITGYLNPTSGSIHVNGLNMAEHPRKARRSIGYLPETPPLYPDMTVLSYLKFISDLRDVPVRQQKNRISHVIGKLGLQGREQQIIRGLSKGYKQRLGLAQAIIHEPDLLILDEPTSGLDPKQIIEIRTLIQELGEKHTVLLSTHILPEVNSLCNRVLIIHQGKIVVDDRPEQIAKSMSSSFDVSLEIKGPRDQVIAELTDVQGVSSVQEMASENSQNETVRLHVSAHDMQDIREAIFYRLAEKGLPILEMKPISLSLEDVFLKLTTEEDMRHQSHDLQKQQEDLVSMDDIDSDEVKEHA